MNKKDQTTALNQLANLTEEFGGYCSEYITRDPDIMGGVPVIRGTRIPTRSVLARIDGGDSIEDILAEYPEIPRAAFEAALIYARACTNYPSETSED